MILALALPAARYIYLAAGLTLTWTVPNHDAPAPRQCGVGPLTQDVSECVLYRQRQSATWVGMSAAMLALPEVWAAYWPQVRAEAAPMEYKRIPLGWADAGARLSLAVTDSAGWNWSVVTLDRAGNRACAGNYVGR